MAKRFFIIIMIDKSSYDYDLLLHYIKTTRGVRKLCILPEGFLVERVFDEDSDRRLWLGSMIKLDVEEITFHEILSEEKIFRVSGTGSVRIF